MKRKIIGNQRRLSTGVISFISCWFRHQQCRDIQRNMSLETKTKTRKTIKKQNQANSIVVSKTTVVPRQRASKRQNSSQIFNLQVINRDLKTRQKQTDVSNTSLLSYIPNLTTDYFQYLGNCAPPCPNLTSLLSVDCYTARGGVRAQFAQILTLIFDPLKQFLLEEKKCAKLHATKKPNYCQTEQYSCENQVFILLRLPQNNTNNLSYIMLLNKLTRWKISKVASFFIMFSEI